MEAHALESVLGCVETAQQRVGVAQLTRGQAVAEHRGGALDDEPSGGLASQQVLEIGQSAHRVDHPVVGRRLHGGAEGTPWRQHDHVAGEVDDRGADLVVGADRDGVQAERGRLAGEAGPAEAVAVALDHGHEAGVGLTRDLRWARHRRPSTLRVSDISAGSCRAEGLVERPVDREVPLADVLHCLATGADLELDQPDVAVVGVERVGDAAQVVDLGAGGQRVGDHRPLDGVGPTHLALLRRRGPIGVPHMGAHPDGGGRRDQSPSCRAR